MLEILKNIFIKIFTPGNFEPHSEHFIPGHIELMWFSIFSNALIVLSYLLIPSVAIFIVRKRKDLVFNWVVLLIGFFILLCGFTHFLHIVVFWYPIYYLQAIIEITTASASAVTFVVLIFVVPEIIKLTVPKQLEDVRERLSEEIESYKRSVAQLTEKNLHIDNTNKKITEKNDQLARLNKLMNGRELKTKELEDELNILKEKNNLYE